MPPLERAAIFNKDLLLDTGVMKTIFNVRNPEREAAFWKSVFRMNFYNRKEPFFVATMTMALECLGYKTSEFDPFQQEPSLKASVIAILKEADTSDVALPMSGALKLIQEWYRRSPTFERSALQAHLQGELQHRSEYAKALFITLIGSNIDSNYSTSLNRMAFSTLLAFDYRAVGIDALRVKAIDLYLLSTFRQMLLEGYKGYTYARPSDSILRAAFEKKGVAMPAVYEDEGEGLDAEIVNFSVVGSHQTGKLNPVAVFTCEKLSAWKSRIERYMSFLTYLLENDGATIYPGVIYQVNQSTGELKDALNVYCEYRDRLGAFKLGQDAFLR